MKDTHETPIQWRQKTVCNQKELLQQVKEVLEEEDCKTAEVYDAKKGDLHYTSATLRKKFNVTFPQIVIQSGLYDLNNHLQYMPKEIIYAQLDQEFERIGSARKNMYNRKRNKNRFPYSDTLKVRLKQSWPEILFCCKQLIAVKKYDGVSKEVLIHEYKIISKTVGRAATIRELTDQTVFSLDVYRQHFSTMKKLREECGLHHEYKGGRKPIELSACKQELVRIYKKYNRRLTYNELKKESRISLSTLFRRFETTRMNVIWGQIEVYMNKK